MENSNKISMLSNNHSFFFVPFKVSDIGIWREAVEANTYLNRNGKEIPVWIKITDSIPVHLMKFVNDGVGYHTKRQYAYSLAEKRAFDKLYKKEKPSDCCISVPLISNLLIPIFLNE